MSLRHHTAGASRAWQFRPSDHLRDSSYRQHVHGKLQPMEGERGWVARLLGWAL